MTRREILEKAFPGVVFPGLDAEVVPQPRDPEADVLVLSAVAVEAAATQA